MMNVEQCLFQQAKLILPLNVGWLASSFQSKVLFERPESYNRRENAVIRVMNRLVNRLDPSQQRFSDLLGARFWFYGLSLCPSALESRSRIWLVCLFEMANFLWSVLLSIANSAGGFVRDRKFPLVLFALDHEFPLVGLWNFVRDSRFPLVLVVVDRKFPLVGLFEIANFRSQWSFLLSIANFRW